MKKIHSSDEMLVLAENWRKCGESVGCVPTMGFLHDGHLSLIRAAGNENSKVVVTIFVNPIQFGPGEDFKQYPRNIENDLKLLENERVDCIFAPSEKDMYPANPMTFVNVVKLTESLCGRSRKDHFRGVTTVVAKLLNLTKPHRAYFGQKDYQQYLVIKKMVSDLNFDVKIKMGSIIRDNDDLALSSRNSYLSVSERESALSIYRSLKWAEREISGGKFCLQTVKNGMIKIIRDAGGEIDYVEILDHRMLDDEICGTAFIAVAAFFGSIRLIDNFLVPVFECNH